MTFLQGECIRLLRERVEDENDGIGKGVSDQTISAVVALAAFEVFLPLLQGPSTLFDELDGLW